MRLNAATLRCETDGCFRAGVSWKEKSCTETGSGQTEGNLEAEKRLFRTGHLGRLVPGLARRQLVLARTQR